MVNFVWSDLVPVIGVPLLRSLSGWAAKTFEDNKVTKFEWKKLIQTVLKVGTLAFIGYLGLDAAGVDEAALIAAASAFVADKIFNAWKKK